MDVTVLGAGLCFSLDALELTGQDILELEAGGMLEEYSVKRT